MKKIALILAVVTLVLSASISNADTYTAQGTLTTNTVFTTRLFNTPDGSDNLSGILGFNAAAAGVVSSPQAFQITFNNNEPGNQAVNLHLENSNSAEGMYGAIDDSYVVPMMWVVYDDPIADGADNNYVFVGDTATEAFVVDVGNVDALTYGNIAYNVDGQGATISNFPEDDGAGEAREISDGEIWVYFGANYTGAPGQDYVTDTDALVIDMITLPA